MVATYHIWPRHGPGLQNILWSRSESLGWTSSNWHSAAPQSPCTTHTHRADIIQEVIRGSHWDTPDPLWWHHRFDFWFFISSPCSCFCFMIYVRGCDGNRIHVWLSNQYKVTQSSVWTTKPHIQHIHYYVQHLEWNQMSKQALQSCWLLTLAISAVQVFAYNVKLTGSRARTVFRDFSVCHMAVIPASRRRLVAHLVPLLAAELWQRWMRISRRFLAKLEPMFLTATTAILASRCLSRTGRGLLGPEFTLTGA